MSGRRPDNGFSVLVKVAALELLQSFVDVVDMPDGVRDAGDQVGVVADDNDPPVEGVESNDKRLDRVQVEVVGRLIQDQYMGV